MKLSHLLSIPVLLTFGATLAAEPSDHGGDYAGTYIATLPERAEILQLHADGTADMTLSDQVTSGAGGFTFSDSLGSWKRTGPRRLAARFVNLNFDVTAPAATYSGAAVVDYVLEFAPNRRTFAASCQGRIFPPGEDPFDPASTPVTTFDCAYLDGYLYRRVPLP
ncbi:MAG TPA: hypothetical protein VF017_03305 [Thermoanaerobaculia bacterium]|nr:hypothetical protein [Thermoanaerobaculia bacterium]